MVPSPRVKWYEVHAIWPKVLIACLMIYDRVWGKKIFQWCSPLWRRHLRLVRRELMAQDPNARRERVDTVCRASLEKGSQRLTGAAPRVHGDLESDRLRRLLWSITYSWAAHLAGIYGSARPSSLSTAHHWWHLYTLLICNAGQKQCWPQRTFICEQLFFICERDRRGANPVIPQWTYLL